MPSPPRRVNPRSLRSPTTPVTWAAKGTECFCIKIDWMALKRPYAPSWVDRLIDWIEHLPIPVWAFYALLYIASVVGLHLASWLNGSLRESFSLVQLYNAIWLPLVFIVIHNTDHLANEAISKFAPAVPTRLAELEDLRYRIKVMPSGVVLALSLIAAVFLWGGEISV